MLNAYRMYIDCCWIIFDIIKYEQQITEDRPGRVLTGPFFFFALFTTPIIAKEHITFVLWRTYIMGLIIRIVIVVMLVDLLIAVAKHFYKKIRDFTK